MMADETKCVNCQRCVSLCPTRALKIVKSDCVLRENANWQNDTIKEIYKQANSGGVLLSSTMRRTSAGEGQGRGLMVPRGQTQPLPGSCLLLSQELTLPVSQGLRLWRLIVPRPLLLILSQG